MIRTSLWASILLLLAAASGVEAGAWLQEPGTAYVRVSGGALATDERFDPNGDRAPFDMAGAGFRNTKYEDIAATIYAEFGVLRDWNLILCANWKHQRAVQPSAVFETYGFSDSYVGVKRSLWRGTRAVASTQATLIFPTGYEVNEYPSLGSDVVDLSFSAEVGASFPGYWVTGEAGYMLRGGVFRNRLGGALGAGASLTSRLGFRGETRGGFAVGSSELGASDLRFDPAAMNLSHVDVAAALSYTVGGGVAVEVEARSTVWGENTLTGTRWGLALATSPAWRWGR